MKHRDVCRQLLLAGSLAVILLPGCASVPTEFHRPESFAYTDTADTRLGQSINTNFSAELQQSGFYPLASGMEAFVARMAVIAAAERSLDLQYYIWQPDTSGKLLMNQLLKAADRGVRVRLLLDDLDTQGEGSFLHHLDAHPNIEIRLYNPFGYRGSRVLGFKGDVDRLNHSMHNKSLTADNQATIVGGRNIGDEYFEASKDTAFADLDVLGIGPVVYKVSTMFDQYWNSDMVVPMAAFVGEGGVSTESLSAARLNFEGVVNTERASPYVTAIKESDILKALRFDQMTMLWGEGTLIYDDPRKLPNRQVSEATHLEPKLEPVFAAATEQVVVVSPYFVPGDTLVAYLGQLVSQGVRVRILTNSLAANDMGLVHAGYMRYRKDLLLAGVELYEFKPEPGADTRNKKWIGSSAASLHAKTLGVDGQRLFVGSFNLDPRAVALNTEMGIIIENTELAERLFKAFDDAATKRAYRLVLTGDDGETINWLSKEDGDILRYEAEPRTGWWQRFATKVLSAVVPESML